MFLHQVQKWTSGNRSCCRNEDVDEDMFGVFYAEQAVGKSFIELMADLAFQTYELQLCVEGLLEDQDG
jgi:hypothetical protein